MKKTFAGAVLPNKALSICRGLSFIGLQHNYGLYGSRIFDRTQLAPLGTGRLSTTGFSITYTSVWSHQQCNGV